MHSIEKLESRRLLTAATFQPPQEYVTGPVPRQAIVADFNGDGLPDIAAPVSTGTTVAILLNNGDGTFRHAPPLPDGIPRAVAAADFNHDGILDLAVLGPDSTSSNGGGLVDVFFGRGDGTFVRPPHRYHLFSGGPAIAAADVNGDGWADLIAVTQQRIAVLINQQNGTFAKPVYYSIGNAHPSGLVVGDFNNDAVLDIAVSRARSSDVSILLGNKSAPGTFLPPSFYPTGGNPVAITSGDFNHDGNLDLAVAVSGFKGTAMAVLLGTGNGTFRPPAFYPGANFTDAIGAADFSDSGNLDIITGSFDGALKLYPGNGDGTFATPIDIPGGQFTQFITTADLNVDGFSDLVVTPFKDVRVLLNSTATPAPPPGGTAMDKTIGAAGNHSDSFYTPDGTLTTVSLSGPGSAVLHFASSSTISIPNGRDTRNVTARTLSTISATGTSLASALLISTAHGSGTITFGSISSDAALGTIKASRANLTGPISLPGGTRQINLLSANDGTMTLGGVSPVSLAMQQIDNETINSTARLKQFHVRLDAGITLTAPAIGLLQVGGSLLNSSIHLNNAGMDIARLLVTAAISSTSISTSGNIGAIVAGNIVGSAIDSGVSLSPGEVLPGTAVEFIASTSIGSVALRVDTRRPSFAGSTIVASRLGALQLGTIQTVNSGIPFGLGSHFIRSVMGTDLTTHRSFRLSGVTSSASAAAALTAQHVNPRDFNVRIV